MKDQKIRTYIESITKIKDEFWEALQKKMSISFLEKGELYAREGERVKNIGFLESGVMRIYYLDDDGNEWNKAFLEENAFLLSNINIAEKTMVYFEALTPCKILKTPIAFFADSLKEYPELNIVFQHQMGELFKRKSEREIGLLQLKADKRYLKFKNTYPHLVKIIPQYHIASYLGITPTQLSRIKLSSENQQM